MKSTLPRLLLIGLFLAATAANAAEPAESEVDKAAREARVKARLAEHAHRKATQAASKAEIAPTAPAAAVEPVADGSAPAKAPEDVTTLPSMEVRNSRITEIDIQIRKLEKDIARERRKMKSSDLDVSLNDAKATKKFALFGGKSTEQRESVAAERVQLMEAERDIMEAMKLPKTRAELALLQKQVDDLRAVRRDLDLATR